MRIAETLLIALALVSPASAQDRFKDVWVTQSASGEVVRGRMIDLSDASLAILTPDNRRIELPLARVLRIEAHGDSLKNGAAIGAAIMGGLSFFACQGYNSGVQCAVGSVFNLGLGALIGAGVDALNGGRSVIYSRPPRQQPSVNLRLKF
jgi:hypothetical protein